MSEPRFSRDFLIERQGKEHVLYAGLLDEAHRRHGLKGIRTQLVQAPSPENGRVCICYAEVEVERGVFTGIGDASPDSVGRNIVPHFIRMAETRAKARALRDAINVGGAAFEELADELQAEDLPAPRPRPVARNGHAPVAAAPEPAGADEDPDWIKIAEGREEPAAEPAATEAAPEPAAADDGRPIDVHASGPALAVEYARAKRIAAGLGVRLAANDPPKGAAMRRALEGLAAQIAARQRQTTMAGVR